MRIEDIKKGGWIRIISDEKIELAKVKDFRYDKSVTNGYIFYLENREFGLAFEGKDFKYSNNPADLIKKNERIVELDRHYYICKSFTKDEFLKLNEESGGIE